MNCLLVDNKQTILKSNGNELINPFEYPIVKELKHNMYIKVSLNIQFEWILEHLQQSSSTMTDIIFFIFLSCFKCKRI